MAVNGHTNRLMIFSQHPFFLHSRFPVFPLCVLAGDPYCFDPGALSGWIAARSIHFISDNGHSAAKTTKAIKLLLEETALKKIRLFRNL